MAKREDNPILWAHYSQNDGFCVKFDASRLLELTKKRFEDMMHNRGIDNWDSKNKIFDKWVHYEEKKNIQIERKLFFDNPFEDCNKKYWTKFDEWSKEEEYRIGVSLGGNMKIEVPECVRGIILGCNPDVDKYIRALSLFDGDKSLISCLIVKNGSLQVERPSSIWPNDYLRGLFGY